MMRTALLCTCVATWTLLGATCLPLTTDEGTPPESPTRFGIAIANPTQDISLPEDATFGVNWTAFVQSGVSGTVRIYVESRTDLSTTTLIEGVEVVGESVSRTTDWDLSGFASGQYVIYGEISSTVGSETVTAPGRVTVNAAPTFEFVAPVDDQEFTQGEDTLTITWTGADPEGQGSVTLGLDEDDDPLNGNEVFIHEAALGEDEEEGSFEWSGNSLLNEAVPAGTYSLFAFVGDDVNDDRDTSANVRITVIEGDDGDDGDDEVDLGVTVPDVNENGEDDEREFIIPAGADRMTIELIVEEFDTVLVDLKIDSDDVHNNGNELTILSQRAVAPNDEDDRTFEWDGTLTDGSNPPAGIYTLVIVLNTGSGAPETAADDEFIYLRTFEDQPIISLLDPAQVTTVSPGDFVTLAWRDEADEGAAIRLVLDDDLTPQEGEPGGNPDDIPEVELVRGLEAAPDGAQDSYLYQVPRTLDPGTYYVFAYIVADEADFGGGAAVEFPSVGPAPLIVDDPAQQ